MMDQELRHIHTASAVLIGDCGRLLFQQRDAIPHILYPGMIGLFGGHIDDGETALEAVRREVEEETGIAAPADRFEPLVQCCIRHDADRHLTDTTFLLRDVPTDCLVITEGVLLPLALDDLPNHLPRMTPVTCCAARIVMDAETAA